MAQELIENPVFPSAAKSWRGPFPWTLAEVGAGAAMGVVGGALLGVWGGVFASVLTVSSLVAWRRFDHDRSDYLVGYLRRFSTDRSYNPNEPDSEFRPFFGA